MEWDGILVGFRLSWEWGPRTSSWVSAWPACGSAETCPSPAPSFLYPFGWHWDGLEGIPTTQSPMCCPIQGGLTLIQELVEEQGVGEEEEVGKHLGGDLGVHFVLVEQVQHSLVDEHDPAELLGQGRSPAPALPALALEGVALQQGRERHVQTLQESSKVTADSVCWGFSIFARAKPFLHLLKPSKACQCCSSKGLLLFTPCLHELQSCAKVLKIIKINAKVFKIIFKMQKFKKV